MNIWNITIVKKSYVVEIFYNTHMLFSSRITSALTI